MSMKLLISLLFIIIIALGAWAVYAAEPGQRWRVLGKRALAFVAIYVGLMLVFVLLESRILYHPTPFASGWQTPNPLKPEDVWLNAATGERIHAWWCPVPKEKEQWVVLYCHGNAGNLSSRAGAVSQWQEQLGASVLIFDYPGYGRSEGEPTEEGCYAAVEAAYDWLIKEKRVPEQRLLVYGKSLGGAMAVDVAVKKKPRALVLLSTFTSVPDMAHNLLPFFPTRWMCRTCYDNRAKLKNYRGPLFIAHGTNDGLIPYEHGERLFAETAAQPKYFLSIAEGDHDMPRPDFYKQLNKFLHENGISPK